MKTFAVVDLSDTLFSASSNFHYLSPGGGMVDAADLKSADRKVVRVRVPPRAPLDNQVFTNIQRILSLPSILLDKQLRNPLGSC